MPNSQLELKGGFDPPSRVSVGPPEYYPQDTTVKIMVHHQGYNEEGSGTIVTSDGLIVTAGHVMDWGKTHVADVALPSGKHYQAQLKYISNTRDLSVIKIQNLADGTLPFIPLSTTPKLEKGEKSSLWGYSTKKLMKKDMVFVGKMQPSAKDSDLEFTAAAREGDSGGPIFNSQQKLVGVVSAYRNDNMHTIGANIEAMRTATCKADKKYCEVTV